MPHIQNDVSIYDQIASVSRVMKTQLRNDTKNGRTKKHPTWFLELQGKLATCYDASATRVVMKDFIDVYDK